MKYIILLNRKFPYLSGETFLENELEIYNNNVDKILIFPSNASKGDKQTRTLPKNVESIIFQNSTLKLRQLKSLILSLRYFLYDKELTSDEKTFIKHSIKKRLYNAYFTQVSKDESDRIYKYIKELNLSENDEVIIYSYWFYINAMVATKIADKLKLEKVKTKVISRAHRFDIYEEISKYGFLPKRVQTLEKIDKVYACSEDGANYIRNKYSNFKDKILVSKLATKDFGLGKYSFKDKFYIVSCSRVVSVKRIDSIIDALKLFRYSKKEVIWTHLGDGELMSHIRSRVNEELGFMKVNLVGRVENKKVYEYYKSNPVDLFINVSVSEGLPVSIMEAISFGTPVVATNVGGTSEIIRNGISGYLIEKDFDSRGLAEYINKILNMSIKEYEMLRANTRAFWMDNFLDEENFKDFYEKINSIENNVGEI